MAVIPMRAPTDARRLEEALHPEMPRALRLDLARAVARHDRATLLGADNDRAMVDGRHVWHLPDALEHVEDGRAPSYFVDVRDDVLACDGDFDAGEAAQTLAATCSSAGLQPVLHASGAPGHRHVFVLVSDVALRKRLADRARVLGFDVRTSIRPPGAPHREGRPVRLLSPATWKAALEALGGPRTPPQWNPRPTADREPSPATPHTAPRRALSPNMAALLATGRHPDSERKCARCGARHPTGYHSRSELLMALALGAVNAGWTQADLWTALVTPSNVGGERVREMLSKRGELATRRYVTGRYRKAVARAADRPVIQSGEGHERLDRIAAAIESDHWLGKTGSTDRAVLRAHLELARRAGGPIHDAAVRDVAEIAQVTKRTVTAARRRLTVARRLAQVSARRKLTHAGRWKLLEKEAAPECTTQSSLRGYESVGHSGATPHGLWRRGSGLGKLAGRVYELLDVEPCPRLTIAKALGRRASDGSLRRVLERLKFWKLAVCDGSGCWRRGPADPVDVARETGAAETDARHRKQHAAEREARRVDLEERRSKFRVV